MERKPVTTAVVIYSFTSDTGIGPLQLLALIIPIRNGSLLSLSKYCSAWPHSPQVDKRRLVAAPPVAQENLRCHQPAVVEVSRVAGRRLLHAGVARRHLLTHWADHHCHVSDGRLGFGRLVAGVVKVDLLLQGPGRLRQSRHHKVVGYTWALVLHHCHLPSPPVACKATEERWLVGWISGILHFPECTTSTKEASDLWSASSLI